MLLDGECLARVEEAQGAPDGFVAEAVGAWCAVCPGLAEKEDKY